MKTTKRNLYFGIVFIALIGLVLMSACIDQNKNNNKSGKTDTVPTTTVQDNSVNTGDNVQGSSDAPVTMIDYSDFECPFCGRYVRDTYGKIKENYINKGLVKYIFRHFPLSFHKYAQKASEASECAAEQGSFWEYHDILFKNQGSLSVNSLKGYAVDLGLDTEKFNSCLDSGKFEQKVKDDIAKGQKDGVTGTPAFFINGEKIIGARPYASFKEVIEKALGN